MERILKYPRTPHLKGSSIQEGDEDLSQISFERVLGKHIVIEEKVDGANVGISFDENGVLLLQSRGHYLRGGSRERHYDLFKKWANNSINELFEIIGSRYIMYGEWLYAKHKIYYDALPHYFMEFDIFDKERKKFLSTEKRLEILKGSSIKSVPVLASGVFKSKEEILFYLKKSLYITANAKNSLIETVEKVGANVDEVLSQTQEGDFAEGLYIKVEESGEVKERMKYVRYGYKQTQSVESQDWFSKTIIPNKLKDSTGFKI